MRTLKAFLKGFITFILFFFFLPFVVSPTYNFEEAKPFSGDKIWNPYYNMHPPTWKRCNFQLQSKAWGGITDGSNNTFEKVWDRYTDLNYDVIGISDYQKINTQAKDSNGYVPIYEHGYNIKKTHQVSIGAKEVCWLDFPVYQTTSHKQFLINLQRNKTDILAIVHPAFDLEGYSHEDLQKLSNYDLLEALNVQKYSISHWDAALSAGRIAYILANDDLHDIDDPYIYGRLITMINAKSAHQDDIIPALKNGNAMDFPFTLPMATPTKKRLNALKIFLY